MAKKRMTTRSSPAVQKGTSRATSSCWICATLLLATFAVYAPVRHFEFINYDDYAYITENPYVRQGVTAAGVKWALTSSDAANWFPVTRLSHMLDVQLFGLDSGWHHLTNALVHALATLMLFAFLHFATGSRWASSFVAFVFAVHPLHVESVAWVAERKDVLCALFWFSSLYAYVRYAERPGVRRYLLVVLPFCLGLMSKPMTVTLPFVLLLLDVWPLRRQFPTWAARVGEKVPLFLLAAAAALITYVSQQRAGAVTTLNVHSLGSRSANALVSYVVYITKTIWPSGLAAFYPYPVDLPLWQPSLAGLFLVAVSIIVLRSSRKYLAVGWLWYLGTLVPVIGIVQVGAQARADRYMYIPMIGLAIMVAWGIADILRQWPQAKPLVITTAAGACLVLALLAGFQIPYWSNSETLFRHALAVTERNSVAHNNLGNALAAMPGHLPEAIAEYEAALEIEPGHAEAHSNFGAALLQTPGQLQAAITHLETALRIRPDFPEAHNNLGSALLQIPDRARDATAQFEEALRLKPDYEEAHSNLGNALARIPGRLPDAIKEYEAALRIDSSDAETRYNLGTALAQAGRHVDARAQFERALILRPDLQQARQWLERLRSTQQ
jgi:tetratricopeptide (TPR) repeat protein